MVGVCARTKTQTTGKLYLENKFRLIQNSVDNSAADPEIYSAEEDPTPKDCKMFKT